MEDQDTILVIQEDQDTILVIQEDQDTTLVIQEHQDTTLVIQEHQYTILETRHQIFQTLFLMNQSQIKEMVKLDIILETNLETLASILVVKDQTALMKAYCFQEVAVQVITLGLQKGQASPLVALDIAQDPRVVGEGRWQETKPGSARQLYLQMMKT